MAYYQIKWRTDSAADWTTANPTLSLGEPGYESDTGKIKIGDGSTSWTSLAYFSGTAATAPYHRLLSGSTHTDGTRDALNTGDIIIRSSTGYWKRLGVVPSSYHYLRCAPTATNKVEWDNTIPYHTQSGTTITGGVAVSYHALVGASHTASGLTTGHFLKASGAAAYGFAAHGLTWSSVGATSMNHTHSATHIDRGMTAGRVAVSSAANALTTATITTTELGYLTGVSANIQHTLDEKIAASHFDAKGDIITGCAADTPYKTAVGANGTFLKALSTAAGGIAWQTTTWSDVGATALNHTHSATHVNRGLTASRAAISSAANALTTATITTTELGYLTGSTGNIRHDIYNHAHLGGFGRDVSHLTLSNIGLNDHHSQSHNIAGATHTGTLTVAKGGTSSATATSLRVIISQSSGYLTSSTVTTAEVQCLTGMAEPIKVRLSTKVSATHYDAKGDILTACGADLPYKTAVGVDGRVLAASSTAAGGVSWVAQSAGGGGYTALVEDTDFNDQPASTSTITMVTDQTANIKVGYAIRFTGGGTVYYAQCTAITAILLTIAGAPLVANDGWLTALAYAGPEKVEQVTIAIPGAYEDANDTTLIVNDLLTYFEWRKSTAYCVYYAVKSRIHDSHATHGKVTVMINAADVNTSAGGLTIAADATWYVTVVDIATANYDINRGETLDINATKGGTGDAYDLTVLMVFIYP